MRSTSILNSRSVLVAALMTSTALAGINPAPAYAQNLVVDDTQTITTPVTLSGSDQLIVGSADGSNGTLTIENGGTLTQNNNASPPATVAQGANSTGTVTVTGPGSSWQNGTDLQVGHTGTGILNIENGGSVRNAGNVSLGLSTGSNGTMTVTGAGSSFTNEGFFKVGNLGAGTLNILNGGSVTVDGFSQVGADSTGTARVSGAGSIWTTTDQLFIGTTSAGTLVIEDGGSVSNESGFVGIFATSGTVTVTGAGSSWTNHDSLVIGERSGATGIVTIADGGVVNVNGGSGTVTIAEQAGATGTLTIGNGGAAGTLNAASVEFGAGTGAVNFNHTDTDYDFNAEISGEGTINQIAGVTNLTADSSGFTGYTEITGGTLRVTNRLGSDEVSVNGGALRIENGGIVNNGWGIVDSDFGSAGTATVTGAGSTWANWDSLHIGQGGAGTLYVLNGGVVVADEELSVGEFSAGVGAATVSGAGSTLQTSELFVGRAGTGTLSIENGGSASNGDAQIGLATGATGTVTVTGIGSSWSSSGEVFVGEYGTGTLNILNGGSVSVARDLELSSYASAVATTLVSGAGSALQARDIAVGRNGAATLTVDNGGQVIGRFGEVGKNATGTGSVTVSGAGSSWTSSDELDIGFAGAGTLVVENGGTVSSARGTIGNQPLGRGVVTVTGPGSRWTSSTSVSVGVFGTGTLTIANGGTVDLGSGSGALVLALYPNSAGTLNIGAAAGAVASAAGTLDAAVLAFGQGDGVLNFNHTATNYDFDAAFDAILPGAGTINHVAGVTNLTGDATRFTGTTHVTGGTLRVNNALGGTVNVTGGTLGGSGTLGNVTIVSGGTLAPGNSIGTLNVGDITVDAGSTYDVEVNSAGQSDLVNATGTATINGGTVRVLPFPDFALGTTYTIATAAGGVTGTFDTASYGTGSLFITPTLTYDANNAFVSLAQTADFVDFAATPNQIATAGGIQSVASGDVFNAILLLGTGAEAQAAYDAASGEIHASAKTALLGDSRFQREATFNRLRFALDGVGAGTADQVEKPMSDSLAFWSQGFGSWGDWDSDGNAEALDRALGGIMLGADALVRDSVRLGLTGGYSRSSLGLDDRASSATVDSYTLGAYAGGTWNAFSLKGGMAQTWHSLDTARSVAFTGFSDNLSAAYKARTFQAYTEASYSIDRGQARFEPYANLAYVNLDADGFTETGGAAALTSWGQSSNATFTTLGIRGETEVALGAKTATLSGGLGWRHAFGATPSATHSFAGGDAFTVTGVSLGRDALVLDAGFAVNLSGSASFGLSYSGQLGSGISTHGGKASLNVRF